MLNYLNDKACLLVLDNFEHLLDAGDDGARLLTNVLRSAPAVKVLITSREALNLVEEWRYPVGVLRTMRQLAGERGAVIVVDERVGDTFTPAGNDVEWMMYGWSVLHCLPVGMADQPSAATGTVMRADTLRGYAREAGFRQVEILPIDNLFFRFYRMHR